MQNLFARPLGKNHRQRDGEQRRIDRRAEQKRIAKRAALLYQLCILCSKPDRRTRNGHNLKDGKLYQQSQRSRRNGNAVAMHIVQLHRLSAARRRRDRAEEKADQRIKNVVFQSASAAKQTKALPCDRAFTEHKDTHTSNRNADHRHTRATDCLP